MNWIDQYKSSLKMIEVEEYFDLFFYRPLAFLLVKIVYPTRITPNQLTYIAILLGLTSGYMYSKGLPYGFKTGALFFMLYNIFDCSDGQLARLKKNGTHVGRIVDGLADYVVTSMVFLGIGIGFANHQSNPGYWWALLVLAGISNAIQSILVDYYRNRFLDYVLQRKSTFEEQLDSFKEEYYYLKNQQNKWLDTFIIHLYLKYSAFQDKFTAKAKREKLFKASPEEYYNKNKTAVRFWVLIGPTAQISILMIFSAINRFDLFFWITIIGFNLMAIIMWLIQRNIDKPFKRKN